MRYAICNETFENWEHAKVCETVAALGYEGLEVAPFTLASRITDVSTERRRELRKQAESHGVRIIGLHWLLAKTEGFHVTSPDATIRKATAAYLCELARACRELGGDLMVFGSPLQRKIPPGYTREQAVELLIDTFSRIKTTLNETGVRLCLEPLAPAETDFLQTCAEAVAVLERLDDPLFVLHQDVKAMSSEPTPMPELIHRYASLTGHFHANDANRRGPGFGDTDFEPIFRALKETSYAGYISVEVFDYSPDPLTIARESINYMKRIESQI